MTMHRREFLRLAGTASAGACAVLAAQEAKAGIGETAGANENAVLVDTTLCQGCRACEAACSEANLLEAPVQTSPATDVFKEKRQTSQTHLTVVNRYEGKAGPDGDPRYAKKQCMHCVEPACASACPVRALDKLPGGPVTYHPERCIGCRYCMVACPFDIPKYEYDSLAPTVKKCTFCAARQAQGLAPACTSVCPTGALKFGKREALLDEAKTRIFGKPEAYVHHVYGEHEAGGTNWLYISDVPFEKLGFTARVDDESYPQLVKGALSVPPFVMTLWPPLLMGFYAFSHRKDEVAKDEEHEGGRHG
jgi:formate dehydrogenase iron-sulfur subunit